MADNPAYGRRLREAKRSYELAHDCDLTWREIGERVGAVLQREPFSAQVVQRWFAAGREPERFAITEAIGVALGADPAWLAFGTGAMQPAQAPANPLDALPAAARQALEQFPKHPAAKPRAKKRGA